MIIAANAELKEAFLLKKGLRPLSHVAEEIGLHPNSLYRWIQGDDVNLATLRKIEQWITRQP